MAISPADYSKAEAQFQAALRSDPGCYDAHVGLGQCYLQKNDLAKAASSYEAANEIEQRASSFSTLGFIKQVYASMQQNIVGCKYIWFADERRF